MAGLMIAHLRMQRLIGLGQLAAAGEAEKIVAHVHGVGSNQLGIEVFRQLDVLLAEHQGGGGLGTDHGVAVADRVGQDAQIGQGRVARVLDVADDEVRHSRGSLARGHIDVDASVAQDRHNRFSQLLVEVIGEHVEQSTRREDRSAEAAACSSRVAPPCG